MPVRSAYQPPANSTFLSEQTSHQQPASSTLLSEQTSTSHQPPANRTDERVQLDRVGVLLPLAHSTGREDNFHGTSGIVDIAISKSTRLVAVAWAKWELFQETLDQ
jgi:hypothetical protein